MSKPFKLQNDSIFLSTEAPGGIYNADQLRSIADLCESDSIVVKATEDHRLALVVKEDQLEKVNAQLSSTGLGSRDYQSGLHQPISCIGSLCPMMEQDALSSAIQMSQEFAELQTKNTLKIGINGCASCCVATHTLDVSIIGDANGYRISLGGKNSQIPEMATFIAEGVPADQLIGMVAKVINLFNEQAEEDETLQDLIQRVGASPFIEAFAPYSQDAAGSEDPFGELTAPTPISDESTTPMSAVDLIDESLPPPNTTDDSVDPDTLGLVPDMELTSDDQQQVNEEFLVDESTSTDAPDISVGELTESELSEEVFIDETSTESVVMPDSDKPTMHPDLLEKANAMVASTSNSNEEETESALEAKLEESILEQEAMAEISEEEVQSSKDRDRALELIENKSSIDHGGMESNSFEKEGDLNDDFDVGDLSEEVISEDEVASSSRSRVTGFGGIQSIEINEEFLSLSFTNGESLSVDLSKIKSNGGRRNFTVNGQEINLRLTNGGFCVSVDGIEVQVPLAA